MNGLVAIHGALLEHGVDLVVVMLLNDLLDALDRLLHRRRDRNPSCPAAHLPIGSEERETEGGGGQEGEKNKERTGREIWGEQLHENHRLNYKFIIQPSLLYYITKFLGLITYMFLQT